MAHTGARLDYQGGEQMPRRDDVLAQLRAYKPELKREFGITDIALFGSCARDQVSVGSDVDVLVAFDGPATARCYFGVQFYLEDLLGWSIDLVTEKALRPELRPYIEREAVHV